jgi:hypothetical protein
MKKSKFLKAPIPGENLTKNTKGYSWHRPPQIVDFDEAFEYVVDTFFLPTKAIVAGMHVVKNGIPATVAIQTMLINSAAKGVFTPDMALLLAGPSYKVFTRLMDALGVKYLTGFDTPEEMKKFLDSMESTASDVPETPKITKAQMKEMEAITEEAKAEIPEGGLMGAPTNEESVEVPMEEEQEGGGLISPMGDTEEDMV